MKALVLSGGGSKGAYTAGMVKYLKKDLGRDYDLYVGTSTGALVQTLSSVSDFDGLKEGYTDIKLSDIYKISPFKKSDDPNSPKFNILSLLRMYFIEKKPTFGDSSNLLKTLHKFFTKEKYLKSLKENKNIVACVTNLSKAQNEYYSSQELGPDGYEDFLYWTWISTNAVPFTSLEKRDGSYYADGGIINSIPIQKAIDMGATEIDAILTRPNFWDNNEVEFHRNPLKLLSHIIDVMMFDNTREDIENAKFMAKDKNVKINIYYFPKTLTNNPLYFDKTQMGGWWEDGYRYMESICKNSDYKTINVESGRYRSQTLNKVLETSTDGFFDWHIDNGYEYLSPKFKAALGYEVDELENRPESWQRIIDPEDLKVMFEEVQKHFESKGDYPFKVTSRYTRKDGSTVKVFCRGEVVEWNNDGSPKRMVGTHTIIED